MPGSGRDHIYCPVNLFYNSGGHHPSVGDDAMKWADDFRRKLTTAARAVEAVRPGDRVWVQPGCATPEILTQALLERASVLHDVEIVHMLTLGPADYTRPEYEGSFRHNGLFLGNNVRSAVAAGRADYTPIFLSEIEALFRSGEMPLDVAIIQTCTPDEYGYLSLGTSIDCALTAARCARRVIAEVNDRMPRTLGETFFTSARFRRSSKAATRWLNCRPSQPATCTPRRPHVASLIPDGATLQTGYRRHPGRRPDALRDHRDLGVHSEMCPDGIIRPDRGGAINGIARRSIAARWWPVLCSARSGCSSSSTTTRYSSCTPRPM